MINETVKNLICNKGREIEKDLVGFYGKITLNYADGKFVVANVEQSVKDDLKERNRE